MDKLPNGVKLPDKLKKVLIDDLEIHNQCNKVHFILYIIITIFVKLTDCLVLAS